MRELNINYVVPKSVCAPLRPAQLFCPTSLPNSLSLSLTAAAPLHIRNAVAAPTHPLHPSYM